MGGRASVARIGATAFALLVAAVIAGLTARAETEPSSIISVEPAPHLAPLTAPQDSLQPDIAPAGDDLSVAPEPASAGDNDHFLSPAETPDGEAEEPADSIDTAAPLPSDEQPSARTAVTPSEAEPNDAAALPADEPAQATDSAAVPPSEGEPQPQEGASPSAPAPAAAEAEESPEADQVVTAIKSKLQDPVFRKEAGSRDVAALEAFYGKRSAPLWITPNGFTEKGQALIAEIRKADAWGLPADAFDLPAASGAPANVEAQASDEIKLALAVLKYARFAQGGRFTPSRISPLFDQKPVLKEPDAVLSEIEAAPSPAAYLASQHPKHDQFEILRKALAKAVANARAKGRKPANDPTVQRLIVNMERWRWMPPELGSYYVWNNVPAFTTRVVKDGKSIYVEKAIVGQVKYPTPIFSADMRSIVFNPVWVVPDTIKLEDIQPRLREMGPGGLPDVSILRENKLSVSLKGRPVAPETVDWQRANIRQYTFTQPPGPDNVLGVLKFNFPNKHAIYMHDTVQPELFKETVRTLSHGCIRVHQPEKLAMLLLAEDKGWPPEQVKAMLAKGNNTGVALKRHVPVHLTYFTIAADGIGRLQTYADIYGLDAKMAQAMFGKAEALSGEQAAAAKQRKRSAWNGGRGGNFLPGLFGN